jgi:hypothetical protein
MVLSFEKKFDMLLYCCMVKEGGGESYKNHTEIWLSDKYSNALFS